MLINKMILLIMFISVSAHAGGTGVGNGGDIVTQFIEGTRFALSESIKRIQNSERDREGFCTGINSLDSAQKDECKKFFFSTMNEMLKLSNGRTVFLLRDEPLLVEDYDGQMREVPARTQIGPDGPVEFNFNHVRYYSPYQMISLMTHEFGHKVMFDNGHIDDNHSFGSFERGRFLLDSVGRALADYAVNRGLIGSYFKLYDHFECEVRVSADTPAFMSSGFSPRLFQQANVYEGYESGIGVRPNDFEVSVIESNEYMIQLRVQIHEQTGCSSTDDSSRWTKVELVRAKRWSPLSESSQNEVLYTELREKWNPICLKTPESMDVQHGSLGFHCIYSGSQGRTE